MVTSIGNSKPCHCFHVIKLNILCSAPLASFVLLLAINFLLLIVV